MDKKKILAELNKMTGDELDKPLVVRMQEEKSNIITGRDLKELLENE